jgi:hypothetical protein
VCLRHTAKKLIPVVFAAGQAGPGRAAGSEMEWSGRLVPLLSLHVLKRC